MNDMLLRLTQYALPDGRHRVELAWEGEGARRTGEAVFSFTVTPQDQEDMRWYLEDFLQVPQEPALAAARQVERRMAALGEELFRAVLQGNDRIRDLWAEVRRYVPEARIEIAADPAASTLPWELLRDPQTRELALLARSFVRIQSDVAVPPRLPVVEAGGPVRILAVICRPSGALGGTDAAFRSVASRLIKGLDAARRAVYDLDLLRPPTFEQLGRTLRRAKAEGQPYHAVHFDGHGTYRDYEKWTGRPGKHGYVAFENPSSPGNLDMIDGERLGSLLYETGVSVLVLNSCHSAHSEPDPMPAVVNEGAAGWSSDGLSEAVRAFGSLAQEAMAAGVGGVVAMRYFVFVVTAAQMAAEFYSALAEGRTLGEAVSWARKNLADRPQREVTSGRWNLQDWTGLVVYEAAPLQLFPQEPARGTGFSIRLSPGTAVAASGLDAAVPGPPDIGFYGRDETLLALDRSFDRDSIVLLHADAGSGKTATAAEFARWYAKTGGVEGPVLWSSLALSLSLPPLLDRIGQTFEWELQGAGLSWLALPEGQRRAVALRLLSQQPVLWIWDQSDPVAGLPGGASSAGNDASLGELTGFLRALRGTRAKVLLTSRLEERGWLGDLPTRVTMPPMPKLERFQLARAVAEKYNRRPSDMDDWTPLLDLTVGNPRVLITLMGQALREGLKTRAQIEAFVERQQTGEASLEGEQEGRERAV